MLTSLTPVEKIALFQKVIVYEFMRELKFIGDVLADRAIPRKDFLDKVFKMLGDTVNFVPVEIIFPGADKVVSAVTKLTISCLDYANEDRKEKQISDIKDLVDLSDLADIKLLIENEVAPQAARWYEYFIIHKLSDEPTAGVVPFAKTCVRRMFYYLGSALSVMEQTNKQKEAEKESVPLVLNADILLMGLFKGKSGGGIDTWKNTKVEGKKKGKRKKGKRNKLTSEGACCRSGICKFDAENGKGKMVYYEPIDRSGIKTKTDKNGHPKYGFACLPKKAIEQILGDNLNITSEAPPKELQYRPLGRIVNKQHIELYKDYVNHSHQDVDSKGVILNFSMWFTTETYQEESQYYICSEDLSALNLSGCDFSRMDFSGANLSGCDLSDANFTQACFVHANLAGAKAMKANFSKARMQYIQAEMTNFSEANFTQAALHHADFKRATLTGIIDRGAIWIKADLEEVTATDAKQQEWQGLQQKQVEFFHDEFEHQQQQIAALFKEVGEIQNTFLQLKDQFERGEKNSDQINFLQKEIQALRQEREPRIVFEHHCRQQLDSLHTQLTQTVEKDDVEQLKNQLKETQNQLAFLQENSGEEALKNFQENVNALLRQLGNGYDDFKKEVHAFKQRTKKALNNQNERIEELSTHSFQLEKTLDERLQKLEERVDVWERWAEQAKTFLTEIKGDKAETRTIVQTLQTQVNQLEEQQKAQAASQIFYSTQIQYLQERISSADNQGALNDLKVQLTVIEEKLKTIPSDLPPDINQQLKFLRSEYEKQIDASQQAINHLPNLPEMKDQLAQVIVKAEQHQKQIQDLENTFATNLNDQSQMNKKAFEELEQACREAHETFEERITQLKQQVDELEGRHNKLEEKVAREKPAYTLGEKIIKLRKMILEDHDIEAELACYVEPNGQADPNSPDHTLLYPYVKEELLKGDVRVLLLEGGAGAGKSTFNRYLQRKLWHHSAWKNYKPGDQPPEVYLPLYFPLGSPQVKTKNLFKYLFNLPGMVDGFTDDEILELRKNYRMLLIADGFDEISDNKVVNLYDTNDLSKYDGRVKLIIGCRTERAQKLNEDTIFRPYNVSPALFKKRVIAPFNEMQISEYIDHYLKKNKDNHEVVLWKDVASYQLHFEQLPELKAFITTPFLLLIILDVLPSIVAEVEKLQHENQEQQDSKLLLTRAKLYDFFINSWFERQENKLRAGNQLPKEKDHDVKLDFKKFCMDFATCLRNAEITNVQYSLESIKTGNLSFLEVGNASMDEDEDAPHEPWVEQLFGDKNPDIMRARKGCPIHFSFSKNGFEFIHASMIDYFFTTNVWEQHSHVVQASIPQSSTIGDNRPEEELEPENDHAMPSTPVVVSNSPIINPPKQATSIQQLGMARMTREQIYFLADRVKQDKAFENYLLNLLSISRTQKEAFITQAAANAISILNAAEFSFSRYDLSSIDIPGADLSGAIMDGAILRDAMLKNVNFQGAWLRNVDFMGANMQGVRFIEELFGVNNYIEQIVQSPDKRFLILLFKQLSNYHLDVYRCDALDQVCASEKVGTYVSGDGEFQIKFLTHNTVGTWNNKESRTWQLSDGGEFLLLNSMSFSGDGDSSIVQLVKYSNDNVYVAMAYEKRINVSTMMPSGIPGGTIIEVKRVATSEIILRDMISCDVPSGCYSNADAFFNFSPNCNKFFVIYPAESQTTGITSFKIWKLADTTVDNNQPEKSGDLLHTSIDRFVSYTYCSPDEQYDYFIRTYRYEASSVTVLDAMDYREIPLVTKDEARPVVLSRNHDRAAIPTEMKIYIYDTRTWKIIAQIDLQSNSSECEFSLQGTYLKIRDGDCISIFEVARGKLLKTVYSGFGIRSFFSPDEASLFFYDKGIVQCISLNTLPELRQPSLPIELKNVSTQSELLISFSLNQMIRFNPLINQTLELRKFNKSTITGNDNRESVSLNPSVWEVTPDGRYVILPPSVQSPKSHALGVVSIQGEEVTEIFNNTHWACTNQKIGSISHSATIHRDWLFTTCGENFKIRNLHDPNNSFSDFSISTTTGFRFIALALFIAPHSGNYILYTDSTKVQGRRPQYCRSNYTLMLFQNIENIILDLSNIANNPTTTAQQSILLYDGILPAKVLFSRETQNQYAAVVIHNRDEHDNNLSSSLLKIYEIDRQDVTRTRQIQEVKMPGIVNPVAFTANNRGIILSDELQLNLSAEVWLWDFSNAVPTSLLGDLPGKISKVFYNYSLDNSQRYYNEFITIELATQGSPMIISGQLMLLRGNACDWVMKWYRANSVRLNLTDVQVGSVKNLSEENRHVLHLHGAKPDAQQQIIDVKEEKTSEHFSSNSLGFFS